MTGSFWTAAKRIVPVFAIAFVASACTPQALVQNLFDNRQYLFDTAARPMTVAGARDTFLLRSSRLFYPNGIPKDPSTLPDLNAAELTQIEELLENSVRATSDTQTRHASLLGATATAPRDVQVVIVNQGQAVAATEASGRIFVDAKVVQSIYRSALLSVLVDGEGRGVWQMFAAFSGFMRGKPAKENEVPATGSTPEEVAFARFAAFTRDLDTMSSFLPLSDAKAFAKGAGESETNGLLDRISDGMSGVLESRVADMAIIESSRTLESAFLGAIEFLVGHEFAHLALGHFPVTDRCDEARRREFDADNYGILLTTLRRFDGMPALKLDRVDSTGFSVSGESALALLSSPAASYKHFFKHAYGLAGFDRAIRDGLSKCDYPSPNARQQAAAPFADLVEGVIDQARWIVARKRSGDRAADAKGAGAHFEEYYASLVAPVKGTPDDTARRELAAQHRGLLKAVFLTYFQDR